MDKAECFISFPSVFSLGLSLLLAHLLCPSQSTNLTSFQPTQPSFIPNQHSALIKPEHRRFYDTGKCFDTVYIQCTTCNTITITIYIYIYIIYLQPFFGPAIWLVFLSHGASRKPTTREYLSACQPSGKISFSFTPNLTPD